MGLNTSTVIRNYDRTRINMRIILISDIGNSVSRVNKGIPSLLSLTHQSGLGLRLNHRVRTAAARNSA